MCSYSLQNIIKDFINLKRQYPSIVLIVRRGEKLVA